MMKIQYIKWNFVRFSYKGDEVIYVFPWARKKTHQRFYSTDFADYFSSLKELDNTLKNYWETQV